MNEHTGDSQRTRPATGAYREGWDRIFSPRNVSPVDGLLWKQEDEGSNPSVETKQNVGI